MFQRLIGIMKTNLSTTIGKTLLRTEELEEALLDIEVHYAINISKEFEAPVITPNILLHRQHTCFLEENTDELDGEKEKLCRRSRHMKACDGGSSSPQKNSFVLLNDMT